MNKNKKVKSILQEIDMYIDEALNDKDREDLINNIQNNPIYSKVYEQEMVFRSFIKDNLKRPQLSTEFKQSIKESLKGI